MHTFKHTYTYHLCIFTYVYMYLSYTHTSTHKPIPKHTPTHIYSYLPEHAIYTHIYTDHAPHAQLHMPSTHTHTIPRHNDTYTFHFSPNTTCLCWCCSFYPKFLSLSSPPTETLPILSRSSPNTTSPMESTSPAGTHFYIFCASRNILFFPWILSLVHSWAQHTCPRFHAGPGTAGGPGATAVNSPGLVPILWASSLLEGRSQSSVGIKWAHCHAGHTQDLPL